MFAEPGLAETFRGARKQNRKVIKCQVPDKVQGESRSVRTCLGSLKSDQDAEDDKCCRFATHVIRNDLFNTRFAR